MGSTYDYLQRTYALPLAPGWLELSTSTFCRLIPIKISSSDPLLEIASPFEGCTAFPTHVLHRDAK